MTAASAPIAQQARSRRTQGRILDASLALIAQGGVGALTVSAIAERAGVSVGSVYRRFGDKDRLLLSVQSEFADKVGHDVASRLSTLDLSTDPTPKDRIGHVVWSLVDSYRANENVLKVFFALGLQNAAVYEAGSRASIESKRVVEHFLRDVEVQGANREVVLDFGFRLLYATLAHRVTQGEFLESDRPLPWDALQEQLTAAITKYFLTPG